MIFLYVEKRNIPVKVIEYIKKNKLDVKIKEIDITTKEILEIYDIKSFPALVSWSIKKTKLAVGRDEIMYYLTYIKDCRL